MSRKRPVLTGRGGESERRSDLHRYDSASGHIKRRGPPPLGEGPRESSGDLLSRARGPGTIGDEGLDFRVRKGNGYDPLSVTAETNSRRQCRKSGLHSLEAGGSGLPTRQMNRIVERKEKLYRAISTARLNVSPRSHLRPIDVVVYDGPTWGCPRET